MTRQGFAWSACIELGVMWTNRSVRSNDGCIQLHTRVSEVPAQLSSTACTIYDVWCTTNGVWRICRVYLYYKKRCRGINQAKALRRPASPKLLLSSANVSTKGWQCTIIPAAGCSAWLQHTLWSNPLQQENIYAVTTGRLLTWHALSLAGSTDCLQKV